MIHTWEIRDAINTKVTAEQYHKFEGTNVIACAITVDNKFTVVGSAIQIKDNEASAKDQAREAAFSKLTDIAEIMLTWKFEMKEEDGLMVELSKVLAEAMKRDH